MMEIEIKTKQKKLIESLHDNDHPSGVSISLLPINERRAFGAEEILIAIISIGPGIGAGVVANWLWDKVKNSANTKIVIDYKEVSIKKSAITEVLEKKINIQYESNE